MNETRNAELLVKQRLIAQVASFWKERLSSIGESIRKIVPKQF